MASLEQKTHADYTVGWICALEKEQTAAVCLLDKRHANLSYPLADFNTYILGSIGGHNIAIACLPMGVLGISPAATVAKDMVRTFPNIRIGLMVGIGGGIPSKVRLGDVVVSKPVAKHTGVVQWDFGNAESGGFVERGYMHAPPNIMLSALNNLATFVQQEGSKIPEYLHSLAIKFPHLANKYTWSEQRQDPERQKDLASASGAHPTTNTNELEEEGFFTTLDRQGKDGHLRFVFGLIGSGNQVIKDAALRDELSKRYNGKLLCVEMEAAGLMNNFPCLVIRGICDYADERKNDDWQHYAAARAAAFAKELLQHLPLSEVKGQAPVKDVLLSEIHEAVKSIEHQQRQEKHRQYFDWLTDVDYGQTHSQHFAKRQCDTGAWFLKSPKFQYWRRSDKQTLLCTGIPGAGKTMMTSIVIEALGHLKLRTKDPKLMGLAYIYYNYSAKSGQELQDSLASLLKQLVPGCDVSDEIERSWRRRRETGTRLSRYELLDQLCSIMMQYSQVFILIDALDECQPLHSSRASLLDELMQLQKKRNLNIFVSSRHDPDIHRYFKPEQTITLEASDKDLAKYLYSRADLLPSCVKNDERRKEQVIRSIVQGVKGMFLLAVLCSNSLRDAITWNDVQACISAVSIGRTPTGSHQTQNIITPAYEYVQSRILSESQPPRKRELAKQVLGWITFAWRPLTVIELQHAIAAKPGTIMFDDGDIPDIAEIVSVCAGLVLVGERHVRLVHYTTQVYFAENWQRLFPQGRMLVAQNCLTYLSFAEFDAGICSSEEEYSDRTRRYPFYEYAAQFLGSHMIWYNTAASDVMYFLRNTAKVNASHQANLVSKGDDSMTYSYGPAHAITGLHLATIHGLTPAVQEYLAPTNLFWPRESATQRDNRGNTLMFLAAKHGHGLIVALLLRVGFGVHDQVSHDGLTAIHIAAENGYAQLVEYLLGIDANVDARQFVQQPTPLILAAENGHLDVVRVLRSRGAFIDAPFIYNYGLQSERTALQIAAECGHVKIVNELLAAGADVNRPAAGSFRGRTALQAASERGQLEVVERLLDAGAWINADAGWCISGRTALQAASENGHLNVMRVLLRRGAHVNAAAGPAWLGKTALQAAVTTGESEAVNILLEAGADIDAAAGPRLGRTVRQAVTENNDGGIRETLEKKGFVYNVDDHRREAPVAPHVHANHAELLDIARILGLYQNNYSATPGENIVLVEALYSQLVGHPSALQRQTSIAASSWFFISDVLESIITEQPVNCKFFLLALAMKDLGEFELLLNGAVRHGGLRKLVWYPHPPHPQAWPDDEGMVSILERHGILVPDDD